MEATKQRPYYVYTLAYPAKVPLSGIVFYVGKGTGRRVKMHEDEARSTCNCKKCEVIRHIWGVGAQVQREIIFETENESEALAFEQNAIRHTYTSSYLVNIAHNPHTIRPAKDAKLPKKRWLLMADGSRVDLDEEKHRRDEEWKRDCEQTRLAKGGFWLFGF